MTAKKFEVTGNVSIVPTGKSFVPKEEFEKVLENTAVTPDVEAGSSLSDMYDRFSKLLYVVDASGSMGEGMLNEETIKQYKWTDELVEQFKESMKNDKELVDVFVEFDENTDEEIENEIPLDVDGMTEEALKMKIISENLSDKYGIPLERNWNFRTKHRSKMMALKDAAKNFVHARFQKWPDARVAVFQFEDYPQLLCAAGASEEEVMVAINRLPDNGGGGTNIYKAVEKALSECKKRPSEVGLHHIVLVSDGADYGGTRVKDLVPRMKELGVVFDFIYMVGASGDTQGEEVAKVLREVCEATGGEYTVVKTEQDFEQKFLAVSNRPMLPAPK